MSSSDTQQQIIDKALHATLAKFTMGLSPSGLAAAYTDWASHLLGSPGKQTELIEKSIKKAVRLSSFAGKCSGVDGASTPCIEPLTQDKRFADPAWQKWPYNMMYQSFLLNQQWWYNATTGVRGVTPQHEKVMEFASRQILDIFSPSNYLLSNPEVLEQTKKEGGQNLIRGMQYFAEDWQRNHEGKKPAGADAFVVGDNVAATPGEVIYRNHLIELIQYQAVTEQVHAEPILIVPAWIMKYYILDLSQQNSLVKYLTEQGFTVFMVSWRNPTADDRDLGMDDYRNLGVMSALDAIKNIMGDAQVHGIGYCLGGTLLSIAAATMAREHDERFKTLTLLAAQVDFIEAGELTLFVNESQITYLEDIMWEQGYLDAQQMAGAFQLLRSNDLIWSRIVHEYLMGNRTQINDLMAWNADTTRMPYKMHSQYLRQLFLNNDLAEGRYLVENRPITISDIRAPTFMVGTERDHVAPWKSVYKYHLLSDTDVTFLLTSGGHNAGIVSEPGHARRTYRVATTHKQDKYLDPESWMTTHEVQKGSWWPQLTTWLKDHSSKSVAPPTMGSSTLLPLCKAPGTYVMQR